MEGDTLGPGLKFDSDKVRLDLVPWDQVWKVGEVLTYGAKKYSPDNWQNVQGFRWRYYGAVIRHLIRWFLGERIDPESGLPHLAHAATSILFLMWGEDHGKCTQGVTPQMVAADVPIREYCHCGHADCSACGKGKAE